MPAGGNGARAALSEGKAKSIAALVNGEERQIVREEAIKWADGRDAKQKALSLQTTPAIELPEVGDFDADQAFSTSIWVKLGRRNQTGAIVARMDNKADYRGWDLWLEGDKVGTHIVNKWPDDALKVVCADAAQAERVDARLRDLRRLEKSQRREGLLQRQAAARERRGRQTERHDSHDRSVQDRPAEHRSEAAIHDGRRSATVRPRLVAARGGAAWPPAAISSNSSPKPADERTAEEKAKALDWWLAAVDGQSREIDAQIRTLQDEETKIKGRGTVAHVMNERKEEPLAYILFRGEYDKRRDPVKAATPAALPPLPDDLPHNRLGLAQWLLRPEHPLTARVTVNRFWQELFGTGLVRTQRRFWRRGRIAVASRTARLAGRRVSRVGLGREAILQAARDEQYLSSGGDRHAGKTGQRRGQSACSRAGRVSAWMPRWSATMPWPPAGCWSARLAARACSRTSPRACGKRWR